MKLELYLQNSNDGTIFDITDVAEEIQVSHDIDGTAGKLTCTLQKDLNNKLRIANGSIISFIVNNYGFFYGYIFEISTDENQNYQITAYDQMRYLKNSDIYTTSGLTSSQIFEKICQDYGLKYWVKVPSGYVPQAYVHDNKTLFSIIERGLQLADIYENRQYFIRDVFGTLVWSEFEYEKTDIIMGANSVMTSYNYSRSIDSDTYNQVKLYKEDKNTGRRDIWIVRDSDNIKRWGTLQFLQKADDNANAEQVRETTQNYLYVKNRETEKLKISAEGVLQLTAGKGIKIIIEKEGIDKWMWIKSSSHTFTRDKHTMELEVEV